MLIGGSIFWQQIHSNFCDYSPFAPLEDDKPLAAIATAEDEQALKEVEGMTLIGQIVHPDCRPVLEFGIVRP